MTTKVTDLSTFRVPCTAFLCGREGVGRLDDYGVCTLLCPYVEAAISPIESDDLLVDRVVISREHVRAYYPPPGSGEAHGRILPEYIEIALPVGLFDRAVDLAHGPFVPFPVEVAPEPVRAFIGRLRRIAFPQSGGTEEPRNVVMDPRDYVFIRMFSRDVLDICSTAVDMRRGFQATLWEHDHVPVPGGARGETSPVPDDRQARIWTSKMVPMGTVWVLDREPPPDWMSDSKKSVHVIGEHG